MSLNLPSKIPIAYLDRFLNFLQPIADRIRLVNDLEDRIAHWRFVEQIIDRHLESL